jgi:hypothetical protein
MDKSIQNPYRHDLPAIELFFGRQGHLSRVKQALTTGRNALMAVMGGRGMGKSSLLLAIERSVSSVPGLKVVRMDRAPRDPRRLVQMLCESLGIEVLDDSVVALLQPKLEAPGAPRLALLIDEIEPLLDTQEGIDFLENLRILYEHVRGRLAVVVFGGSRLRLLLQSDASPFLRTAKLDPLMGLSRDETIALMQQPLGITIDEADLDLAWSSTNGHPLLLQALMEVATDRAIKNNTEVPAEVRPALAELDVVEFSTTTFTIWWENLAKSGQIMFSRLIRSAAPVRDEDAASLLGDRPFEWIQVLESTGVTRRSGGVTYPRGELFRQWYTRNFALASSPEGANPFDEALLAAVGTVPEFERAVVRAVARWVHDTLELPFYAVRDLPGKTGNALLQEEAYFQISLLQALRQHGWLVEAESLSVRKGARTDLKIRTPDLLLRACGELKRWAGTAEVYKGIVTQVLGYVVDADTFAFTVMVDRLKVSLAERYARECIPSDATRLWPASLDVAQGSVPAFVTEHPRANRPAIRVYHFLVQLPPE